MNILEIYIHYESILIRLSLKICFMLIIYQRGRVYIRKRWVYKDVV